MYRDSSGKAFLEVTFDLRPEDEKETSMCRLFQAWGSSLHCFMQSLKEGVTGACSETRGEAIVHE